MTTMEIHIALLALQVFHVAFLWLHDWIPLGRLNDLAALRQQDSLRQRIVITLIQGVPWTLGLIFSTPYINAPYPGWVRQWLWISYGILFVGELRAWWLPYLVRAEPERAARYRRLFGTTHAFLPVRNGFAPNTLHVLLHLCTFATLILLAMLG